MKRVLIVLFMIVSISSANKCDNKTFSLNAYAVGGTPLTLMDVVADLTQQCGITAIFSDNRSQEQMQKSVNFINIKDYYLDELFDLLFAEHNLFYMYDKTQNMLRISYYKMENFNVNYINMSELKTESVKSITVGTKAVGDDEDDEGASNSDLTTITATSKFTFWDKLQEHIVEILATDEEYSKNVNKVLIDRDAAVVTVTGTKRQLKSIKGYLKKIQSRMHSQVMIDAHIIELTYNDSNSSGVDWSKFELNLNPNASFYDARGLNSNYTWSFAANFSPTGIIKFLDNYGDVEIVSNPKVLTLNNQPAVINVGKQLSYLYQSGDISNTNSGSGLASSTTYKLGSIFVGLTLNVVPEVTENGRIIMRINPVTSELLDEDEVTKSPTNTSGTTNTPNRVMPPDTRVKQMSSIVKVKDGERVMIGGLIEKKLRSDNSKVPVLGDIPLLGKLFSHEGVESARTELFIILTPTLIKNDTFPSLDEAIRKRIN